MYSKIEEEDDDDYYLSHEKNENISKDIKDKENPKFKSYKSLDIKINKINKDSIINDLTKSINKKGPRINSMSVHTPHFFLDEKEDILMNLSKKQRKTSDYSDKDSLCYKSRETILAWCQNVLNSIKLTDLEKNSIFYRFCTAYDFIMEKLFLIHQSIKEEKEFKFLIITIFLLTYKLEGFSITKITISNLIDAFLSEFHIEKEKLRDKIFNYEMRIIKLIDFNPQIFDDNNIYQLSFLLLDLFNKKFNLNFNESEKEQIEKMINYINKSIEFSNEMIFDFFPIDKAMISFYNSVNYYFNKKENIMKSLKEYFQYLKNEMKVVKLTEEDLNKFENQIISQVNINLAESK